jgi:hypothetical protein
MRQMSRASSGTSVSKSSTTFARRGTYPGSGIGFIDAFWRAASQLDPAAADLDEGRRFPFCTVDGLAALCGEVGLEGVDSAAIETVREFPDFEAFWQPPARDGGARH